MWFSFWFFWLNVFCFWFFFLNMILFLVLLFFVAETWFCFWFFWLKRDLVSGPFCWNVILLLVLLAECDFELCLSTLECSLSPLPWIGPSFDWMWFLTGSFGWMWFCFWSFLLNVILLLVLLAETWFCYWSLWLKRDLVSGPFCWNVILLLVLLAECDFEHTRAFIVTALNWSSFSNVIFVTGLFAQCDFVIGPFCWMWFWAIFNDIRVFIVTALYWSSLWNAIFFTGLFAQCAFASGSFC